MPRAAAARQEALLHLIATDPSLAKSVDTETLKALSKANAQPEAAARSLGCDRNKVMLYTEGNAGQKIAPDPKRIVPEGKSRRLRERSASRATPIVLLDSHALSHVARPDNNQERSGVRRFDSSSSMASSASSSSATSLASPSTRSVGYFNSSQRGRSMTAQAEDDRSLKPQGQQTERERGSLDESEYESSTAELTSSRSLSEASANNSCAPTSRIVLDHRCFVDRSQWVPHRARKKCFVCQREFSVLRKRHSCRMCGEVICSRCSVFKHVNLPIVESKQRVCSSCFVTYRRGLDEESELPSAGNNQKTELHECQFIASSKQVSSKSTSPAYVLIDPDTLVSITRPPDDIEIKESSTALSNMAVEPKTLSSRANKSSLSDTTLSSSTSLSSFMSDWTWADSSSSIIDPDYLTRSADEELEAVIRAKHLEQEVESSQERIRLLEAQIADQENQKDLLSLEQQSQLKEARATIKMLQEQLRRQEHVAREAAHTRDSICLQNLQKHRMTELHADSDTNQDDDSAALRKRLKVLERQLQQAGISVAEVIPYEVAKRKVTEISRRLQELSECQPDPDNKQAQALFKKEYFVLEQEIEKYHTALMLSDEYIEEQQQKEQAWENANHKPNENAAKLLWSAIPVNIAQLSERDLVLQPTPTGLAFPSELAKRLKRTNVLQLMRVDPKVITKMHPSVIEAYRTTGLSLVERRALHHIIQEPFRDWRSQQQADEMARRKFWWYSKLKDALALAIDTLDKHLGPTLAQLEEHTCELVGLACPLRLDSKSSALYDCGLGFPSEPQYLDSDIIKGDPDGAGNKAKKEADLSIITQKRRRELQAHYGSRGVREIALSLGTLEETDDLLDRVQQLDASFPAREVMASPTDCDVSLCASLLSAMRELVVMLAKRSNVSLTGKRELATAIPDTRSAIEVASSASAINFCQLIMVDIAELFGKNNCSWPIGLYRSFQSVGGLHGDVTIKNEDARLRLEAVNVLSLKTCERSNRVRWCDRVATPIATVEPTQSGKTLTSRPPRPAVPATSSALFDAIRTRRRNTKNENRISATESSQAEPTSHPSSLLASIRSRKNRTSTESSE